MKIKSLSYMMLAGTILSSSIAMSSPAEASETQNANKQATQTDTQSPKDKGKVAKPSTKDNTSKTINFDKAKNMSPKEMKSELTKKDKQMLDKDINENKSQQKVKDSAKPAPKKVAIPYSGQSSSINNYIKKNNFKPAPIKEDRRIDNLPKYNYKSGKYVGVVVHDTANDRSTLDGEVNYMYNNWRNAFIHAYVDSHQIRQTAPADYLAWGAGAISNGYHYHIELVHEHSYQGFAKSVNNDAYLTAYMLKRNGLKPKLADTNGGKGTIISHSGVSKYYGGTNHTDPVSYFQRYGYSMTQYTDLVKYHYNKLNGINDKASKNVKKDYHKVVKGDTLYKISKRYGVSIDNLKDWNSLKNNTIHIGQRIYIIPSHQVKKGETLYRIANSNNMSVKKLKSINHLKSDTIRIGQMLKLK